MSEWRIYKRGHFYYKELSCMYVWANGRKSWFTKPLPLPSRKSSPNIIFADGTKEFDCIFSDPERWTQRAL